MSKQIFVQDSKQLVETLCRLHPKKAPLIRARRVFVENYCRLRNWDPDRLTLAQVLQIRRQGGWKQPPDWRLKGDYGT